MRAGCAAAAQLGSQPQPGSAEWTEPVSLARDIEEVIDACKKETEAAARAYYQVRGGPGERLGAGRILWPHSRGGRHMTFARGASALPFP